VIGLYFFAKKQAWQKVVSKMLVKCNVDGAHKSAISSTMRRQSRELSICTRGLGPAGDANISTFDD
jgi:hypothetical protein